MDNSCFYCEKDQRLDELMIEIKKLNVSTVYLFKEQTYRGRCLVAYEKHAKEFYELSDEELDLFMKDVRQVARAIQKAFSPDKINYGAYADTLAHLHFHIVPKYQDGYGWGSTFEMNPHKVYLEDSENEKLIAKIRENL